MSMPPIAPVPPSRPATRRAGALIGLLCSALLAGCAANHTPVPSLSAHLDEHQHENWLFQAHYRDSRDPIRDMLIKQSREQALAMQKAHLADAALEHLGVRYRWGGEDPETGFDCSGLISYAAQQSLGLKVPRRAADMAKLGQSVKRDDLQAGDLVFFNTLGRRFSHVGIYVGDDHFVHAPSSGGVVRVESMKISYWAKRYNGARRLDVTRLASNG